MNSCHGVTLQRQRNKRSQSRKDGIGRTLPYHLCKNQLTFDSGGFNFGAKRLIIIEKTLRSIDTYPIPKISRSIVEKYIPNRSFNGKLLGAKVSIRTSALGRELSISAKAFADLIMAREVSYVGTETLEDMERFRKSIVSLQKIDVFEENTVEIIDFRLDE